MHYAISPSKNFIRPTGYGRLRIYYPFRKGLSNDKTIKVHSKLMIVDTSFVRIGSANLNNRSMGLDSECDLAIEASGADAIKNSIAALRNRLLAEHLEVDVEKVAKAFNQKKSLADNVDRGSSFKSDAGLIL